MKNISKSQNSKLISLYNNVLFIFECFRGEQHTQSKRSESCQMAKMFFFLHLLLQMG